MLLQRILITYYTRRCISTSVTYNGVKAFNREGKFMKKMIYGEIPKKKWYPAKDGKLTPLTISKSESPKPHVTRRVTVRNKLFMKHITDLMATGEISSLLLGLGIEITRVNVTNDSKLVKVFWFSSSVDAEELKKIEKVLNECAFKLRHELSRLRVIGVVPPIQFFKDRQLAAIAELEKQLANADYGDDYTPTVNVQKQPQLILFTKIPNEVREKILSSELEEKFEREQILQEPAEEAEEIEEINKIYDINLPPMRNDVLNLDHSKIMTKIIVALKKCAETSQNRMNNPTINVRQPVNPSFINCELRTKEESEAFDAFLLNRRIQEKKRREADRDLADNFEVDERLECEYDYETVEDDVDVIDDSDLIQETEDWRS